MSLIRHAKYELKKAGLFDKDSDYDGMLGESVLELIKVFSKQGHSGYSAYMTIDLFKRLASFKMLSSPTTDKEEWLEVTDNVYQSRRQSNLFSTDLIYYYNIDDKNMNKCLRLFIKNIRGLRLRKLRVSKK